MSNYWYSRLQKQQDELYDKTLEDTEKQLAKYYKSALKSIQIEMTDLYAEIVAGAPSEAMGIHQLYQFNRFFELQAKINKELTKLDKAETEIYSKKFAEMYMENSKLITIEAGLDAIDKTFIPFTQEQAKAVVDGVWCADGKHWSMRIWGNKQKLQQRIEKGLIDCISRGLGKDELVKQLMNDFGVGFNEADRIARTELTYIQNQSAKNTYLNAGIEKYKYLAYIDGRTAQVCKDINGKIYDLNSAQIGVNFPPMHANCRCTIVAKFDL